MNRQLCGYRQGSYKQGPHMNPYGQEWTMYQNTALDSAEMIQNEPVVLLPSAGENDQDDFSPVRRIKLDVPTKPVDWGD